jgi:hypothetical protein
MTVGGSFPGEGREPKPPESHPESVAFYDPKPDHLWNRLHTSLFARTTSDGKTLGLDELDPLLWPPTRHLLTGPSHDDALKLLDEFLTREGDKQIRDPLKRAVLQHDLWAVFEWTAFPYGSDYGVKEHAAERRALQARLAQAIHRLALAPAAVDALPDNYADAVKSKAFAARYDPDHPEKPFLPDDLFEPDGPWVGVGGALDDPGPTALAHTRFYSGRSVFLVFLRASGDRKETLAYLKKLNNVPSPWALRPRKPDDANRRDLLELSPDLPQPPAGSQVALVRQMVLVTDAGELAASPVTESVQFRVYQRIRKVGDERREEVENGQRFFEFDLRRSDLFAGKAGGLRPLESDRQAYLTLQFLTGFEDPFEPARDDHPSFLMPAYKTCAACHSEPGVYSIHSFTRRFSEHPTGRQLDLALWPTGVKDERHRVLEWKGRQYDWGLLRGLSAR